MRYEGCDLVALVAGDAVSSLDTKEFLRRADLGCAAPDNQIPSPVIPNSYDKIAQWQMEKYGGSFVPFTIYMLLKCDITSSEDI